MSWSCRNKAFTLMELLVVVAIIALLVGIVVVSMRGVRASATRTESLGALRQMALAYGQYTVEHDGRLMPGYISADLFDLGELFENLIVSLPDGTKLDALDKQSYVWRLAPHLDNAWLTFFSDTAKGARSVFAAEYNSGFFGPFGSSSTYDGGVSERPSYGMNSLFVGGDSRHGGAEVFQNNPWTGSLDKIAATRLSEVKNPSRLIVFGPAALASTVSGQVYEEPEVGFCELRAPYTCYQDDNWKGPQWMVGTGGFVKKTVSTNLEDGTGLPIARSGQGLMPVAHLDGSTVVEQIGDISRDMRRWSPFEVGVRKTVDPIEE
jgi:prepilin-type N-terminal cleavage/methylation domain-containing protein